MARNAGCLNMKVVEIILLLFLMACSLSVFLCRNLLVAAILFMANSLIMSIIWVILQPRTWLSQRRPWAQGLREFFFSLHCIRSTG